ncbi:sentrin-specific protease 5-like [Crassostrea virginica]
MDDPSVTKNCYILMYEREFQEEDVLPDLETENKEEKIKEDKTEFVPDSKTEIEEKEFEDDADIEQECKSQFDEEVVADSREFVQRNKGNASSVCKTIGPYQVRFEDLQSLEGTNWITDQVVNSYLYLVQLYANDTAFLDSFWLPHCLRKGVAHIRKCEELQNKRLLLIPIHKPAHWGLVIAYIQEGYFILVDTLKAFGNDVAAIVRRFLLRHKIVSTRNKALEQKFKPPIGHIDHCGPYILNVAKNAALGTPPQTKWKNMNLIRQEIKEEIMSKQLHVL